MILFHLSIFKYFVNCSFSLIFIIFLSVIIFLYFIYKNKFPKFTKEFEISEAKLGIGDTNITIKPNFQDKEIAYKLWVEMSTRKIGMPLDFEHDVITEVYDSWYEFFKISRELIKEIPVTKIKYESTQEIIKISMKILNKCLRPCLTKWQAKFRKWYSEEIDENKSSTPQQIQQSYENYDELKKDMERVNTQLIYYKDKLEEISFGS